jgi:RNA polymerase sigma-70 factor (ECF subfamily)
VLDVAKAAPPLSVEDLALRAQAGDVASFDEIMRRLRPPLRAFLVRRRGAGDDADDLVQEAFLRAHAKLASYDPSYRFSTWLYTIASNLAISRARGQRPAPPASAADGHDPRDELARREQGARLWRRAAAILTAAHYEVLRLRYADDLDIGEISARTGRSATHVRVLLFRARRALAKEMAG